MVGVDFDKLGCSMPAGLFFLGRYVAFALGGFNVNQAVLGGALVCQGSKQLWNRMPVNGAAVVQVKPLAPLGNGSVLVAQVLIQAPVLGSMPIWLSFNTSQMGLGHCTKLFNASYIIPPVKAPSPTTAMCLADIPCR